jgi:hypothetical protein
MILSRLALPSVMTVALSELVRTFGHGPIFGTLRLALGPVLVSLSFSLLLVLSLRVRQQLRKPAREMGVQPWL